MKKYSGTRYNSRWDGSTSAMVGAVVIACLWPDRLDDWMLPMAICAVMLVFVLLMCVYRFKLDLILAKVGSNLANDLWI